jgi:hypothetical protein
MTARDELREAVMRALFDTMHPTGTTWRQWEQQVEKHGGFDGRNRSRELAQAALSAARPFIAAECAKVAEDEAAAWQNKNEISGTARQVAQRIATAIKETIR